MRIVDLSLPINNKMQGIPMLREFAENPTRCVVLSSMNEGQRDRLKRRGIDLAPDHEITLHMSTRIEMLTHIGTHIDAPCHFVEGDVWSVDEIPLELTVKTGRVIPLTHKAPRTAVTADDIRATGVPIDASVIPVLNTGWTDRAWGTQRFWNEMIYLDTSAAAYLVERGVSAVALDFFPEAPFWIGIEADAKPGRNHRTLLGNQTIIIQMITNAGAIGDAEFTLAGVPLRLEGIDGSPARVFAMIG
jgi:kynurenine formamidase